MAPDLVDRLVAARDALSAAPWMVEDGAFTVGRIRRAIRKARAVLAKSHGAALRVVVVDHFHQLDHERQRGEQDVSAYERTAVALQEIAKTEGVHIIIGAQFTQEASKKKRPCIWDIRGAAAIRQNAHRVVLVHRDFLHFEDRSTDAAQKVKYDADALVVKNRGGQLAEVPLKTRLWHMEFCESADGEGLVEPERPLLAPHMDGHQRAESSAQWGE
jgi:replicative DNA helicase